jgi:hypothetical protein
MGNKDLPAESGGSALLAFEKISRLGVNPTTQTRCTKVVSQLDICWFVFGKIRRNRIFGLGQSLLASNKQNHRNSKNRLETQFQMHEYSS